MKTLYTSGILILLLMLGCQNRNIPNLPTPEYIYNPAGNGPQINLKFTKGRSFNHPIMAIWVEDEKGDFVQTLYVSESIGKGIFQRGDQSTGKWLPGEIRRPAAVPYWSHRRGIRSTDGLFIPDSQNPIPDAYTGPTPPGDFSFTTNLDDSALRKFAVYFEINQTWDWNEFWTNNKYPDDIEYNTSCQPALVYMTLIDLDNLQPEYQMKVIGHSHHSGRTGELFSDLSTITTALEIVGNIIIKIVTTQVI